MQVAVWDRDRAGGEDGVLGLVQRAGQRRQQELVVDPQRDAVPGVALQRFGGQLVRDAVDDDGGGDQGAAVGARHRDRWRRGLPTQHDRRQCSPGRVVARHELHPDGDRRGQRVPRVGAERVEVEQVGDEAVAGGSAGVEQVEQRLPVRRLELGGGALDVAPRCAGLQPSAAGAELNRAQRQTRCALLHLEGQRGGPGALADVAGGQQLRERAPPLRRRALLRRVAQQQRQRHDVPTAGTVGTRAVG